MTIKSPHEKYKESFHSGFDEENEPNKSHNDMEPSQAENEPAIGQEQICKTCPIKIAAEEDNLRALAEMDNFKKRLSREHSAQLKYATKTVLASLLPTLDNLDLALQYGSQHEACKDILMGVELTRKLLVDAVKSHGLEFVGEIGEDFSPELHEALNFEVRDDMEEGKVCKVLQGGYKLKDRLIRPAKVSISKKP